MSTLLLTTIYYPLLPCVGSDSWASEDANVGEGLYCLYNKKRKLLKHNYSKCCYCIGLHRMKNGQNCAHHMSER